jgi:Flp pilus assembly protein TadD
MAEDQAAGPDAGGEPRNEPGGGPESAYELLQRGHALMRGRHNAQAALVLARAARVEPGKGSILEALGRARFNSGQHEAAREAFEALLEVDPSSHYAHFALGQSLKKLGREREAWTHLRLAVALSPGSAVYRAALARLSPPDGRVRVEPPD